MLTVNAENSGAHRLSIRRRQKSRGMPAYSGKSDIAASANDDKYYTSSTPYIIDLHNDSKKN